MSLETPNRLHAAAVIQAIIPDIASGQWFPSLANSNGFNDNVRAFDAGGAPIPPAPGVPSFYRLTPTSPIDNDQMVCVVGYPSLPMAVAIQVARIGPPPTALALPAVDDNPEGDLIIGVFSAAFAPAVDDTTLNTPVQIFEIPRNVTPTLSS